MTTFWPSMYPRTRKPCWNASTHARGGCPACRKPIRYTFPVCCASTASGAASTAPRPVTKARRFTRASRLHLRLCLLQPVRHPHLAVHRRRGREMLLCVMPLPRPPVEPAEAEVAVSDDRTHPEILGGCQR